MAKESFPEFIERERQRINAARDELSAQQRELQDRMEALNREFAAIDAYIATREGKPAQASRARRTSGTGRKGSKREELIRVIREHPSGLSRGDIITKLGLKGNKSGEMSISNALTALTKSNSVMRQDGKYIPGPVQP